MEFLPNDLWPNIFKLLGFKEVLKMQFVSRKFKRFTYDRIIFIEKDLKKHTYKTVNLRHFKLTQNNPGEVNLLWALKDTNFNCNRVDPQQPRNANCGFGFINNKWIWIRGPFKYAVRYEPYVKTKINLFQGYTISSLCKYLKGYEVRFMCSFIDRYEGENDVFIGDPTIKQESSCIIS